ncbi:MULTISPECIES: septation protein SepH [unclassified Curtobacterium]|uniref:septation protein SepH n=1 Tax=unclassified Curtobacterium TaxID=257496 RepID=UPI000DA7AF61|nr:MULTISPECIES: septation protein SepH [unclassified Curtobacterium]PZE75772.1 DUF3071 domain-containing protein [Curtobacterium sp. MCBD17_019]PZF60866.1 DUF3071 domain-containing protein [Curtobacterium sp. MCBD17_034]PZM40215.1 DUF3071 domain-containing protein [Curtobacterium sp. MCBD17_031]WIB68833.1 septation protein SepH [Curtobacterium sp. MCBD17_035]
MQDVRVIGVEPGAILLATDSGSEYRLAVTPSLSGQVRQASPAEGEPHRRIPPKEIQARIRAGLSSEQVAELMGVAVEDVRRFEGPVMAERSFVLDAARRVSVTGEAGAPEVFGDAITARLEAGDATDVRWSSRKDVEHGWQVQVHYIADEVEHDAQWRFDPKTSTLTPDNGDAHRLSREDDDEGLTPRLRAVDPEPEDSASTRFDSGAFRVETDQRPAPDREAADRPPLRAPLPRIGAPAVEERGPGNETADLLEALRRRRGEREAATFGDHSDDRRGDDRQRRSVTVVDIPLDTLAPGEVGDADGVDDPVGDGGRPSSAPRADESGSTAEQPDGGRPDRKKRSRRAMPSWDEIVFGTRPDDDLA